MLIENQRKLEIDEEDEMLKRVLEMSQMEESDRLQKENSQI